MTMTGPVPYSLVTIKPFSIGRGHGPEILADLLRKCPITLRMFRSWTICPTTYKAMLRDPDELAAQLSRGFSQDTRASWICLFTHIDRQTDPTDLLAHVIGPLAIQDRKYGQIRFKYWDGNMSTHPNDTIVRLSDPKRVDLEAGLLFKHFDEMDI